MPDDITQLIQQGLTISAGTGAIVALVLYIRRIFKGMGLEDAQIHANTSAVAANDAVLQNLQSEIARLSKRVGVLEEQVVHLSDKLANVRLVALECYEIALGCHCADEARSMLLSRLRDIIREA